MSNENTRGEHHTKYSLGETRNDPMPKLEVFEKVREGCEMHMNQLDNDGYCAESDEYVVALAFFEDYLEELRSQENFVNKITDLVKKTRK
jgi:hypothetical protein